MLDVRTALRTFFKQIGGKHDNRAHRLGERPTVLFGLPRDAARLEKAIGSIFARPGKRYYILRRIVETSRTPAAKSRAPHISRLRSQMVPVQRASHDSVVDALRESGADAPLLH